MCQVSTQALLPKTHGYDDKQDGQVHGSVLVFQKNIQNKHVKKQWNSNTQKKINLVSQELMATRHKTGTLHLNFSYGRRNPY